MEKIFFKVKSLNDYFYKADFHFDMLACGVCNDFNSGLGSAVVCLNKGLHTNLSCDIMCN